MILEFYTESDSFSGGPTNDYVPILYFFHTDVPMAPASLKVTHVTANTASIEWDSPLDDGGSPVENFILEKRESGWKSWEILTTLPPSVRECELENMSPSKDYFVRIRAVNKIGQGPATEINTPIRVKGITKGMSNFFIPISPCR